MKNIKHKIMPKRLIIHIAVISILLFSIIWLVHKNNQHNILSTGFNNSLHPKDTISVRLPIPVVEAGQTPFYVAEELGYYAEENLNVEFNLGSKELNPVRMVASGADEFGVLGGPDTLLVARSRGQPLVAISVIHRNSDFPVILTLKESNLTTLKDLDGKRIGFFYGHISTDVLRNLFRNNNITVKEVDVGFDYSQLIAGNIDGQWAFRVTAGLNLPEKGIAVNEISPSDYQMNTHGYTIFTTKQMIEENPETVLRFLRATIRGINATLENPRQASHILYKRGKGLDRELEYKRLLLYNEVTSNSRDYPIGRMDEAMFSETYLRLREEGVIETDFDFHDAYTVEFLEEINPHLNETEDDKDK
ncbi:MAG: ABC transporter substrate-binding protein [Candidatus Altiarchaeota archaeon]